MILDRKFTVVFAFTTLMILCLTATSVGKEIEGNARVNGKICGTAVQLTTAKFNGDIIEIYEGNSWGQNPSVLIFLFDNAKLVAPNQSIQVKPDSKSLAPHLHCRYRPKGEKNIDTEIVSSHYTMTIRFQKTKRGFLPAKFKLSVPKEDTELEGFFFLKQENKGK